MIRIICVVVLAYLTLPAVAATVTVTLKTPDGSVLKDAVIYITPTDTALTPPPDQAIMDQVDTQFMPHILVIQKGTEVLFPNSDSIKHHVYSFSKAKVFELKLYRDQQPEPLAFEQAGVVEMGCNIHDWMLGYIFVVDTPYFNQLDETNTLTLEAPGG